MRQIISGDGFAQETCDVCNFFNIFDNFLKKRIDEKFEKCMPISAFADRPGIVMATQFSLISDHKLTDLMRWEFSFKA